MLTHDGFVSSEDTDLESARVVARPRRGMIR